MIKKQRLEEESEIMRQLRSSLVKPRVRELLTVLERFGLSVTIEKLDVNKRARFAIVTPRSSVPKVVADHCVPHKERPRYGQGFAWPARDAYCFNTDHNFTCFLETLEAFERGGFPLKPKPTQLSLNSSTT